MFCVNFNPASTLLVSGGFDETLRIWDVQHGNILYIWCACSSEPIGKSLRVITAHSDPITAVCFDSSGLFIASCAMDGLMFV